ncbi:acetyltransferase [Marinobacterium nitratireducens]|uniref:Acetyltransferase n=1 Tax=Marinobacterium nitratireducens TaxID=518897 RepID=A0A917ZG29_9GAMM|nr:GNAT family N-acetyltransferase [Marinobacterium nitratireducens]GGO81499.1 acetyltransferase [Marinobacterium nitratireducens]
MPTSHPAPVFRPARKSDCAEIAALYAISSDGVANYVWTKLAADGEDILDVGRRRYENEQSLFSYRSCTIVELDGRIAGMLVAFPMHVDPAATEADPVLAPYSRLEEDNSYYICGMALFPKYRGRGIGSELLALAERQARAQGFDKTSLIVFEQNEGAYRLYQRSGYREVSRAAVVPHPLIHYSGDAILMVKTLQ